MALDKLYEVYKYEDEQGVNVQKSKQSFLWLVQEILRAFRCWKGRDPKYHG